MKKIKFVALILVVCMLAVLFTACDEIFKKNEERDFNQVVATVSYTATIGGKTSTQTKNILKGDLAASYASYGNIYVQYYGMSEEEAADYLLKQLYQREALIMFAKAYLIKNGSEGISTTSLPENVSIKSLLTDAEINKAIKATNEDMKSSLDDILTDIINDNKANVKTDTTEEEPTPTGTSIFKVFFNSNSGSEIDTQKITQGTYVDKPTAPTKEGYKFGGWFVDKALTQEYDFKTAVESSFTLYAKWYEYTEPRAVLAKEEEEEIFDPQVGVEIAEDLKFFDGEYLKRENGYLTFKDMESGYTEDEYFEALNDGIEELQGNLKKNYRSYNYFLEQQMATVMLEKLERVIGNASTVSQEEINAEYNKLIEQNKEDFARGDTNYETSLKSSLTNTIYHSYVTAGQTYGFVNNILLKFNADELKQLTDLVANGTSTTAQIIELRNQLALSHMVKISNPDYDASATCENLTCEDSECDPMTCPNHSCNTTDINTTANYNSMIQFVIVDGKPQIKYNVTACPTMAYLLTEWPAYTTGEKVGVVNQFNQTMQSVKDQVTSGNLSEAEGIYWMQKLATAWLYLVGDDSGSVNSENNNGGLGYLVKPEEAGESGYISEFENLARSLIATGAGSYDTVVGDNFIDEKTTEDAYCGIFIIFTSYVPYDVATYGKYSEIAWGTAEQLPLDYIVSYDKDGGKTVSDIISEQLLENKQTNSYNEIVNSFLNGKGYTVEKFDKIIKQVYED